MVPLQDKISRSRILSLKNIQLKLRHELRRISKQHPSSSNSDIMKIASSNLKLNVNEDGTHRPCEYTAKLGINQNYERKQIYRLKKTERIPSDQVPSDVMIIRHLKSNILTLMFIFNVFDNIQSEICRQVFLPFIIIYVNLRN